MDRKTVKFKKIGGGSFRIGNKIYKKNEIFEAFPEQIPKAFRDILIPLEDIGDSEETNIASEDIKEHTYSKEHQGGGWYHIFDENGKQISEQKLRKDAADEMIESLRE